MDDGTIDGWMNYKIMNGWMDVGMMDEWMLE